MYQLLSLREKVQIWRVQDPGILKFVFSKIKTFWKSSSIKESNWKEHKVPEIFLHRFLRPAQREPLQDLWAAHFSVQLYKLIKHLSNILH